MIEEIEIRDLGVIAEATLPLGAGFTAITGETGAGKTMVVTALGLLLGGRADSGTVRSGQERASVDGRWVVPEDGPVTNRVREAGGDVDPFGEGRAELTLGRSVSAEGRSRASVGGRAAPIGILSELGERLVVVHGQSEQLRLKSATAQRDALDRFAGAALAGVLADYAHAFSRWRANASELDTIRDERDARASEAATLRETIAEIEVAAPQPGEDDDLATRAVRLGNLEALRLAAAGAREALSAEEPDGVDVVGLIGTARRLVDDASDADPTLAAIGEQLANIGYLAADVAADLSTYLAEVDADGARELEIVNERRATLTALMRAYGPTLDDVIAVLDTGSARLLELDSDDERIEELGRQVADDEALVLRLADEVSALRSAAAAQLGERVSAELTALAMPDAQLTIVVDSAGDLTASGRDDVRFLLQPHSGAEPRSLAKGASGGELSRVMLAIEVVIAGTDPVPTFVFDEVDSGVGGAAAIEIGRRLARLAETAQVIAVTHLAQVAAFASNHLSVRKQSDGSVTSSSVVRLEGDERVSEMARLLSGLPDSESGLAHAEELLALSADDSRLLG
ncbi:DNA repair protein RecN [Labedella endophytica]|uniref:DNA repair protein RecN n=1 Tax=Labedella endophytica TaxID=1523160 RepID=A0A3S0VBK3_9MICO|nr:DNA repair protein RecN [Labedella endophytica]RUR01637.1 DNA repair protein RecN [Labedella endophytica]